MRERAVVIDIWAYAVPEWSEIDLSGFEVEARDGEIGSVHESSREVGSSYVVVDTGPWIFGKKVMLPAGMIERIEPEERTVHVALSKEEIRDAPEFDEARYREQGYRDELGTYYANRPPGPDYGMDDRQSEGL